MMLIGKMKGIAVMGGRNRIMLPRKVVIITTLKAMRN